MPPFCKVTDQCLGDFSSRPGLALLGIGDPLGPGQRSPQPRARPRGSAARPPGAGETRLPSPGPARPSRPGRLPSLGASFVRPGVPSRPPTPPTHTHAPREPGPSPPSRPGLALLPSNVPSFVAPGGGLATAPRGRARGASGPGTGLHPGPAGVAAEKWPQARAGPGAPGGPRWAALRRWAEACPPGAGPVEGER